MQGRVDLLENHLAFLRTHRGRVTPDAGGWRVESDRPEFTFAVLGPATSPAVLERFRTVHLVPWSGPWEPILAARGYTERGGYAYMTFAGDPGAWAHDDEVRVAEATDAEGIDAFSEVQARAFCETPEEYASWHPWLARANHANAKRPEHSFYVGRIAGTPAGAALTVRDGATLGVYAVATPPAFRRRGVGATLLARAIGDGRARGATTVTLQAAVGSYAEGLYARLGFETIFRSRAFTA